MGPDLVPPLRRAGLDEDAPDRSTLSRFRLPLVRRGLAPRLFAELNRQLEAQQLVLKQGALLDASLVAAQVRRPGRAAGAGGGSERDPDASWTRTGGRATSATSPSGRRPGFGPGPAGRAASRARERERRRRRLDRGRRAGRLRRPRLRVSGAPAALRAAGVKDRIKHRRHKHLARLPHWQRRRNQLIERRRAAVERVFATLKQHYGYRRVRYRGLERNALELLFKCMAYNLRRADRLRSRTTA